MRNKYISVISPSRFDLGRSISKDNIETALEVFVRNVKYRLTPSTDLFTAEVWINSQKAGIAKENGSGINYKSLNVMGQHLFRVAESYAKYFPSLKQIEGPEYSNAPLNFKGLIGLLVKEHIDEKERQKRGYWQKIEKSTVNSIVYGRWHRPFLQIKFDMPLDKLQNTREGMKILSNAIADLRDTLKPGEAIFNRNLNGYLQGLIEGPGEKPVQRKSPKSSRKIDSPNTKKSKRRR